MKQKLDTDDEAWQWDVWRLYTDKWIKKAGKTLIKAGRFIKTDTCENDNTILYPQEP